MEKIKASALLTMATIGQHEKAIQIMRAETKNDFFYFNKLRTKLEGEGRYAYEAPLLKGSSSRNAGRHKKNRFMKAIGTY